MRLPGSRRGGLSLSPRPARSSKGKDRRSCRGRARTVCLHRRGVAGGRRDSLSSGAGGEEGALSSKVAAGCGKKKKKKKRCLPNTRSCCHTPARGLCQAQRRGLRPRSGALPSTACSLGTHGCSLLHQGLGVAVTGWSFWSFGSRVGVCPFSHSRARCCSQK